MKFSQCAFLHLEFEPKMAKQYDLLVRLLIVGDSAVGKTCMLCRFVDEDYNQRSQATTIGIQLLINS